MHFITPEFLTSFGQLAIGLEQLSHTIFDQLSIFEEEPTEIASMLCLYGGIFGLMSGLGRGEHRLCRVGGACILCFWLIIIILGTAYAPVAYRPLVWRALYYFIAAVFIAYLTIFLVELATIKKLPLRCVLLGIFVNATLFGLPLSTAALQMVESYWVALFSSWAGFAVILAINFPVRRRMRFRIILTLAALWAAGLFAHYWAVTRGWPLLPEAFSPHLDMSAVALTLAGILLGGMIWILWMKSSLDQRFAAHVIERANEVASHDGNLLHLEKEQARNEERQRIMQDLHDGIGSHLLLALMTVRHGAGAAVQNNVGQLLQECLDDLRLVIDALSGDSDLIPLLANFRVRMESRFDELALPLQWRNHSMPESCPIAHSTGLHLMRMLQEALANVLKHAQATQIHVDITFNRAYLQLRISDDGRGIIGGNKTMGRGLNNMQIRAQKIGATVTLQHLAPGTAIVIDLPMQESGIADGSGTRKRSRDDG